MDAFSGKIKPTILINFYKLKKKEERSQRIISLKGTHPENYFLQWSNEAPLPTFHHFPIMPPLLATIKGLIYPLGQSPHKLIISRNAMQIHP
jgi:hypothetical protein